MTRIHVKPCAPSMCPACGYLLNMHAHEGPQRGPLPGDWGVCVNCAVILILDADTRPALPAPGAFAAFRAARPDDADYIDRARVSILLVTQGVRYPEQGGHA